MFLGSRPAISVLHINHMVRNHQDGYPYINLSLFFFWKYTETSIFFEEKKLVNEFRAAMGGGLLGISKKIISIFKTWQKMITKFGQFKKLKWPFSSLQFCIFFFFENVQNRQFLLEKLLGQWIPDRNGWGIARDIQKNSFHFLNLTKNGNKVWTILKAAQSCAVQCSAVPCFAVQCSAVQCSAVQCSAVQCSAVHYTVLHWTALHCTSILHCTRVLYFSAMHITDWGIFRVKRETNTKWFQNY